MERNIYNLTCSLFDRIRSPFLGKLLLGMVVKLRDALKGEFTRLSESFGVRKAWEAAKSAVAWGYGDAWAWRGDAGFARFFAVLEFNASSGWG